MRVAARHDSFAECPAGMVDLGFRPETQVLVTVAKEYEVYAISRWRGISYLQVIDDTGTLSWYPTWLFEVRDASLPNDWLCNFFESEIEMIMGPDFVARDMEAYTNMVELHPHSVDLFWARYKDLLDKIAPPSDLE